MFGAYGVAPGSVLNSRSLGFNDNGTLFGQIGAFNYQGPTTEYFSTVGGTVRQPVTYQEFVINPMERKSFFGKFDFDVDGLADRVRAVPLQQDHGHRPGRLVADPVRGADHARDQSVHSRRTCATILASRPTPGADFTLNQRFMGLEYRKFPSDFTVGQYILGLRGDLPFKDWRWDIYGSYDTTDLVETQDKALLNSRMRNLLYAADGGASICAGGFNPFGLANSTGISAACRAYIEAETHDYTQLSQTIFEASLTGALFAMPAGDLRFALTLDSRDNDFEFDPDPSRENEDIIGTLQTFPAEGSTSVKEVALEFLVPLLRDKTLAQRLELNLGVQKLRLRDSPGVSRPTRPMACGSRSTASRSAAASSTRSARRTSASCTTRSARRRRSARRPGRAIPATCVPRHEPARTAPACATLCVANRRSGADRRHLSVHHGRDRRDQQRQHGSDARRSRHDHVRRRARSPSSTAALFSNLSLSVDYYDIDISNVIAPIAGGTALSKCYNLDGSNPTYDAANPFCAAMRRNPTTGGVDTVAAPYLNLGGLRTSGIDAQIDWKIPVGPGSLDLNILANFTDSYEMQLLHGLGVAGVRGHDRRHAERRHPDPGLEDADVADLSPAEASKAACAGAICRR